MSLYVIFGLAAFILLELILASFLDSREHIIIKGFLFLLTPWLLWWFLGIIVAFVTSDAAISQDIRNLVSSGLQWWGIACYVISVYALFYILYTVYKYFMGKSNA